MALDVTDLRGLARALIAVEVTGSRVVVHAHGQARAAVTEELAVFGGLAQRHFAIAVAVAIAVAIAVPISVAIAVPVAIAIAIAIAVAVTVTIAIAIAVAVPARTARASTGTTGEQERTQSGNQGTELQTHGNRVRQARLFSPACERRLGRPR
jgi:hypothetical protein